MISKEAEIEYLKSKPCISLALNGYCSHGCWYCCDSASIGRKSGIVDVLGPELYISKVLEFTDKLKTDFRINGGEPFENKNIIPVSLGVLNEGHDITFLSNLTCISNVFGSLKTYKKQIRFEASFHLAQYLNENNQIKIDNYLNIYFPKATIMSRAIQVIIVLTEDVLNCKELPVYLQILKDTGEKNNCEVTFCMQELYASVTIGYGAFIVIRKYPGAYTEKDKIRIVELKREYQTPDFEYEDIEALCKINRVLYLKGRDCFNMNRMIDVHMDGKVSRCYSGYPYRKEDLMLTKIRLSDRYSPCVYDSCRCVIRGEKSCLLPNNKTLKEYNQKL
jgi:organic radical activating enzyme